MQMSDELETYRLIISDFNNNSNFLINVDDKHLMSNINRCKYVLRIILTHKIINQNIDNNNIVDMLSSKDEEIIIMGYNILRYYKNLYDTIHIMKHYLCRSKNMILFNNLTKIKLAHLYMALR